MFGLFFTTQQQVETFKAVSTCDIARFKLFFHAMLEAGVYLAPSAFEAGFVSSAHTAEIVEATLAAARKAFAQLAAH
jgi:glutamate-1-semialdehyde 2,1-aminomutase